MQHSHPRNPLGRPALAHLPTPWPEAGRYEAFYQECFPFADFDWELPWLEIRIPPKATAEEVYRRLPSAPDFEYGGYLTRTRIRYARCEPCIAYVPSSKTCTFHTHPTAFGDQADVPSGRDIYQFLRGRHCRTITVGARLLWVWDKTPATLTVARTLADWEAINMLPECRRPARRGGPDWIGEYIDVALQQLRLPIPPGTERSSKCWRNSWPDMLRTSLGLKVAVFEREALARRA
ncbi:MAG: hypothetical protein KY476_17710 [Planctomycetes bacterium]|nr:hypothetical protein [Planctomycetota bacterium]